jgi:hypothetical protein
MLFDKVISMENSDNATYRSMTRNSRIVQTVSDKENATITNIVQHNKTEYNEEPLLSLPKACAPLVHIIHNLLFYVQMALDETPAEPSDGLTVDESAAIRLYTIEWEGPYKSLYAMLNDVLTKGDCNDLRPYFKYMKLFLTALTKLPCVPSLTVWCAVSKDLTTDFPSGTPVSWRAFSSCTSELTMLKNNMYLGDNGDRTLFSIEVTNGRSLRTHSHYKNEDEILLLPGTHMIVQSQISPTPDLHIIHLKQVIPKEILLEHPFKGN